MNKHLFAAVQQRALLVNGERAMLDLLGHVRCGVLGTKVILG